MYFKLALGNVRKSMRDYGVYFFTLVFGVCVFYAFNSMTEQSAVLALSETQSQMLDLLSTIIGGVSVFVAIILGFLIVYASRYLIRRRKKEFGTYLLLGMQPFKVSRIIIYETLFVGILSLLVGLLLGFLLSQALLYITAALFTVTMDKFLFIFSVEAFIKTVSYFAVIFLVALLFNVFSVSRYKLIDLINAEKISESIKLRNIPLSIILFIISLVLIGVAYDQLLQNGMREFDGQFALATVLVCIGTLLFFYSLSGFLLRAVQLSKRLYYRGLNMFKLRQLSAKINTAFASITLVCMALFLAITSTCGGFALGSTFTQNLETTTIYDVSFQSYYPDPSVPDEEKSLWELAAEEDNHDMELAFKRDVKGWNELVKSSAQIDYYVSDVLLQHIIDNSNGQVSNSLYMSETSETKLDLVRLSDFNELRSLAGLDAIELQKDEYLLWCDFEELQDLYRSFIEKGMELTQFGMNLHPHDTELQTLLAQTGSLAMNTGTLVINDELFPKEAFPWRSTFNVMYKGEREVVEPKFIAALEAAYPEYSETDSVRIGWPYMSIMSALDMYEQNNGLSATIAYLAIYIGVVLLVACAAILSLQQLSEAADNVTRYSLLRKIGADNAMINRALFTQIGIYFLFPLIVALAHSFVALSVVLEVSALYGHLDISGPLLTTVTLFLVVYGGYFLLTYFASRSMLTSKAAA